MLVRKMPRRNICVLYGSGFTLLRCGRRRASLGRLTKEYGAGPQDRVRVTYKAGKPKFAVVGWGGNRVGAPLRAGNTNVMV